MPPRPRVSRPILSALALLLTLSALAYSAVWIVYIRSGAPAARLGVNLEPQAGGVRITSLVPGTPAERAGLLPGDRIVTVDGRPLTGGFLEGTARGRPGQALTLGVERRGAGERLAFEIRLEKRPAEAAFPSSQLLAMEVLSFFPVPFLVVGLGVLFARLDDRNAWLLALLFCGLIAGAPLLMIEGRVHPALRGPAVCWKVAFTGVAPALFCYFFAVFPARSPVDRRLPWLKHALLWGSALVSLPLGLACWRAGGSAPLHALAQRLAPAAPKLLIVYAVAGFALGLLSLVWNAVAGTPEVRRKTRVLMWGILVGFLPGFVLRAVAVTGLDVYRLPFWVWAPTVMALFLVPISFAYAVVKHRVLDLPVLLKRSARYVLVKRGFRALTVGAGLSATVLLATSFSRLLANRTAVAVPAGLMVGVVFGALLVAAGMRVERTVASRIDRAFFRSAYDARQVLQELGEQARAATDRQALAALLEHHVREALHPRHLVVYLEETDGRLRAERGAVDPSLQTIPDSLPALRELARRGQPWELPPGSAPQGLEALDAECLVPILGRQGRLVGLLALGERLSEEPYSGEDRRLLASVAGQAGITVENIHLAERMAERLEAERRTAYEMEIAKQVQSRLFPQVLPMVRTLEYAGGCRQARAVGGDYYDFFDLGPGRLGLVLADVAGKGISAALLMATLQASLRSQSTAALGDPSRLLLTVNRLFYASSGPGRFATLFYGAYDDETGRLRYANCGHNPPVLLRAGGGVDRLSPTATVLGLFEDWECAVAEAQVRAGDLLLVFSDGASEAWSDEEEEFGEGRLIESLRAHRGRPVDELLASVTRDILGFSGREQEDDLTLVVARGV